MLFRGGDLEGFFGGDKSGALLIEEIGLDGLRVGIGRLEGGTLRGLHEPQLLSNNYYDSIV